MNEKMRWLSLYRIASKVVEVSEAIFGIGVGAKLFFFSSRGDSEAIFIKGVFSDLLISLRLLSVSWPIVELLCYACYIYSALLLRLLEFFGESKILFSLLFSFVPDRKLGPGIWLICDLLLKLCSGCPSRWPFAESINPSGFAVSAIVSLSSSSYDGFGVK